MNFYGTLLRPNFRHIAGENPPADWTAIAGGRMNRSDGMFAVAITCHGCGRHGSLIWETQMRPSRTPIMANLASLSGDFHLLMPRSYRGDLEIACRHCGEIQYGIADRMPVH